MFVDRMVKLPCANLWVFARRFLGTEPSKKEVAQSAREAKLIQQAAAREKRAQQARDRELRAIDRDVARVVREQRNSEARGAGPPPLLLAQMWRGTDPTGWWISEKLDGVRAFWTGQQLVSRSSLPFECPPWFVSELPHNCTLDGELSVGRGQFRETVSIVRAHDAGDRWRQVYYHIFDVPSRADEPFESRVAWLAKLFESAPPHLVVVSHVHCRDVAHLRETQLAIERNGGEGLMLRKPGSLYEGKRSGTLLKVKSCRDAEAEVVAHQAGNGKYAGRVGALLCRTPSGVCFSLGSGLTDDDRTHPPPLGSTVVYRFQSLTPSGAPRFPTYHGPRIDLPDGRAE
eukprot:gnl/Spiro4/4997_TR2496_c0_g1_i1.p1 gnl/Spiro4/4997_TR2496_c0_g1~~gnl/Spiro4/4997_TR2496_c0_g1_i1.p1  ORF type:complete len:344 (-),score=56.87 gnl/Spiro4/4997_TR2496_c0_g1_i1:57-1088(-)